MKKVKFVMYALLALSLCGQAYAAAKIKPFVLAANQGADIASAATAVKQKLAANGFEVVGDYSPYDTVTIITVTNSALKDAAPKTP